MEQFLLTLIPLNYIYNWKKSLLQASFIYCIYLCFQLKTFTMFTCSLYSSGKNLPHDSTNLGVDLLPYIKFCWCSSQPITSLVLNHVGAEVIIIFNILLILTWTNLSLTFFALERVPYTWFL